MLGNFLKSLLAEILKVKVLDYVFFWTLICRPIKMSILLNGLFKF